MASSPERALIYTWPVVDAASPRSSQEVDSPVRGSKTLACLHSVPPAQCITSRRPGQRASASGSRALPCYRVLGQLISCAYAE